MVHYKALMLFYHLPPILYSIPPNHHTDKNHYISSSTPKCLSVVLSTARSGSISRTHLNGASLVTPTEIGTQNLWMLAPAAVTAVVSTPLSKTGMPSLNTLATLFHMEAIYLSGIITLNLVTTAIQIF